MTYKNYLFDDIDIVVKTAEFENDHQTDELHLILYPGEKYHEFNEQFENLEQALLRLKSLPEYEKCNLAFKRYFLSDAANQAVTIEQAQRSGDFALSMVQQPPMNGSKLAVWAYLIQGTLQKENTQAFCVQRNGYRQRWATMLKSADGNTVSQTQAIFGQYNSLLRSHGESLKDDCIRIWLFVQNIDVNYAAVVKARKELFEKEGLNEHTHYISSTGIEGRIQDSASTVLADAYSIGGLDKGQISFLYAPDHLSATSLYGVTFERGTCVTYGDRRHVYISGTASINRDGHIVYPNQIEKQMQRTLENIAALLQEAEAGFDDLSHLIVYIRDTADYQVVNNYLNEKFPQLPKIIVWAPVCRPGWLIEMECMAIKRCSDKRFRVF